MNWNDLTIKPTTVHSNKSTRRGNSNRDYSPLGSLDSGTDVKSRGSGRNIDKHTGVNTQGPIGTIIPESNSASNCDIFDSIRSMLDLTYRVFPWNGAAKSESEKFGGRNIFEMRAQK